MCDIIVLKNQKEICSLRDFKNHFKIKEPDFDWWDNEEILDLCMCEINFEEFFNKHFPNKFEYGCSEWFEI